MKVQVLSRVPNKDPTLESVFCLVLLTKELGSLPEFACKFSVKGRAVNEANESTEGIFMNKRTEEALADSPFYAAERGQVLSIVPE